jgi:sterol 14-demethylase
LQAAWAAAEEEQRTLVARHGPGLSIEALNDMDVLGRNILEALRLFPPLILLLRAAKAPFAVTTSTGCTHIIPKVRILAS